MRRSSSDHSIDAARSALGRRRQISIDICRPRPDCSNQLHVAALLLLSIDGTDRRTDTAPLLGLSAGSVSIVTSQLTRLRCSSVSSR